MWQIKDLKNRGKKNLKNNLWTLLLVGLFMTLIIGEYFINNDSFTNLNILNDIIKEKDNNLGQTIVENKDYIDKYFNESLTKLFTGKTTSLIQKYNEEHNVTKGVFYTIFNAFTIGKKQLQNIAYSMDSFGEQNIGQKTLILIVAALALGLKIFISNPILIGESRIYLESINYRNTKLRRMLFPFRRERYIKTVKSVLRMKIYQFLWNFTIIGGIIKSYSYKMCTYIIAENPNISSKDVIRMSREMMNKNKWQCFKLDLSFILWYALEYLSFGLFGIYVSPYVKSTYTALYETLRKDYIENKRYNYEMLNDNVLFDRSLLKEKYPDYSNEALNAIQKYPDNYEIAIRKIKIDYDKKYKLTSLILFFFIFSFAGWLWEVGLFIFNYGVFVNRGTLYGPWLPIYGTGCTLIIIATQFKTFRQILKKPFLTFFVVMIGCTVIEYLTSWYIEIVNGVRYWDYTGIFCNINGRVCLESAIFFGIGGSICVYFIAPFLERLIQKFDNKKKIAACIMLVSLFSLDQVYSHFYPHIGEGITEEMKENKREMIITTDTNLNKELQEQVSD